MKNRLLLISSILVGLMGIIMLGCQKENLTAKAPQPYDQNSTEASSVTALNTFDALSVFADVAFSTDHLKSVSFGTCPILTIQTAAPITLTFDWGTGCVASDSITRKGKIKVSLSGLMNVVNSVATFTFVDFYSGGNKISGVHTITYAGLNPGSIWPRYEVHTDARITFPDGKYITYQCDYHRLLAEGSTTSSWTDDVWRIEGTWSGKTREGVSWSATCNHALVKKATCDWFDSGTLVVTSEGVSKTIDFGDGTCDNKATLTIGDHTTNIKL